MDGLEMEVTMTDDVVLHTGLGPDSLITLSNCEVREKDEFRHRDVDVIIARRLEVVGGYLCERIMQRWKRK